MNPVIYFPFLRAGDVTYTAYARRIEALDSAVHLCITTRCDSARDPHGEREVLSLTLGRDELLHLSDVVLGGMQLLDGNNGETPDWMRPESHPGLHCKEGDVVIVVQVEPGHEAILGRMFRIGSSYYRIENEWLWEVRPLVGSDWAHLPTERRTATPQHEAPFYVRDAWMRPVHTR